MNKKNSQTRRGILCCAAGAVSWGISGTLSEAFFQSYPVDAAWVTAVRMLAAGILLLAWAYLKKVLPSAKIFRDRKSVLQILVFSLAGFALCQFAYLNAIRWSNAGTATVLQNLSLVFVALSVCVSARTLPDLRTLFCIALALAGVWLISTGGKSGNLSLTPQGLFWGIAAGFGAASYSLLSQKPVARWGSIPVTGMGMTVGGGALFAAVQAWQLPEGLDLRAFALLAAIVLVGTVGAFTFFLQGIHLIGPVKASLLACLEPLTAVALSSLCLGSRFSAADLAGSACILMTVRFVRK